MTMSEQYFDYEEPSVKILEQLASTSLVHKSGSSFGIEIAVRSFVILHHFYGKINNRFGKFDQPEFNYKEWRDWFFQGFIESHQPQDTLPHHKADDLECPCRKTIKQWLFDEDEDGKKWKYFKEELDEYYQRKNLKSFDDFQDQIDNLYPFHYSNRTIKYTFNKNLKEKGWLLEGAEKSYKKLSLSEIYPLKEKEETSEIVNDSSLDIFTDDSYTTLIDDFKHTLNDVQRLLFYSDYRVPNIDANYRINYCRDKLKTLWSKLPVPVIKIKYQSSSSRGKIDNYIIFPVCIFYYQRSFYLTAFGQFPKQLRQENNWYNYRLDRIQINSIQELDENPQEVPQDIINKSQEDQNKLELDQNELIMEIRHKMEEAYGFDFYLEEAEMILRFPQNFNKYYMKNTNRHETFKEIDVRQALRKLKDADLTQQQIELLTAQIRNNPDDGYYTLKYRQGDNTVIMRLRAWCPNVEVLLPWDLRQRMKKDMQETWKLYENDPE